MVGDIEDAEAEIDALALYTRHGVQVPGIPSIVYAVACNRDGIGPFYYQE